uniref:G-protein coupled receptors family 1 profile domain-containing protein n=1 Tax=Knipowitschia caucasica TaxID=637954 RepID=A0AAV2K0H7_KNICA
MNLSSSSIKLDNATLSLFKNVNTSIAISAIYMVVTVVNLFGNGLSVWLLVFRTFPKTPSIIFMINLTLTDLALGAALPFQVAYQLQGYDWNLGPNMCRFLTMMFFTNMYCSILTMMAISIDRYLGIVRPLFFRETRQRKSMAVVSCLLMWGVVLSVLYPFMTTDLTFHIPELGITTCFDVLKKSAVKHSTMMLNPVLSKLVGKLIVLASASPRRQDILRNAGLRFEVVPSWFKETLDKSLFKAPHEYAVETAKQKALEVARRMPSKHLKTPDIVIGADTIVTVDGLILEKPADKDDAYRMLSRLSGKEHSVFTGVAIILCHEKDDEVHYQLIDFYEETKVKFADLSEDLLWEYINSGEPMDKAGGYGIQALGGMLVECVHGDFLNVVGFPLNHFCKQLSVIYSSLPSSDQKSSSVKPDCNDQDPSTVITQDLSIKPSVSPLASPAQKVKRKGTLLEMGESSQPLTNSLSKHGDCQGSEHMSLQNITSRGRSVSVGENTVPKNGDLQKIITLMDGFRASKALFTASKMGVFDLLQRSPGMKSAQVAAEIKASVKGTQSLLEACASLGLLTCSEKAKEMPVYKNSPLAAQFLGTESPFSLHSYILHTDCMVWPLFSHLENAVREGTNQHEQAFGKKAQDLFQDTYYDSQALKLRFMNAMHSIAKVTGRAVATAFDLSTYKTACDLGGCTGAIAHELSKANPQMSVIVFDLPTVIEMRESFKVQHNDTADRVTFMAGDFFKDDIPKADLFVLTRILHDWSDDKVDILLRRISERCSPGCGVLLSEIFLHEDRSGPSRGLLQALSMSPGRQRSAEEYSALLEKHGPVLPRSLHRLLTPPKGAAVEMEEEEEEFRCFQNCRQRSIYRGCG